jgi:hypothetical protein
LDDLSSLVIGLLESKLQKCISKKFEYDFFHLLFISTSLANIQLKLIDRHTANFFFPLSLYYRLAKNVSLFFFFSSRKIYVLCVACTPATLSRTYMVYMFIKDNARPTVTILKNTSSSTIVINRLEREEKKVEMKERILVLYVYDSWDHPVGHRRCYWP